MHLPFRLAAGFRQRAEEAFMIGVVPEDVLPPVATIHHMIQGARILDAQFARHGGRLAHPVKNVNSED